MGATTLDQNRGQQQSGTTDQALQQAKSTANQAIDHAKTMARNIGEQARAAGDVLYRQGQRAGEYLTQNVNEYPLTALLIAGMIGYGLAFLVHTSWQGQGFWGNDR